MSDANKNTKQLPGSVGVGDGGGIIRLDDVTNTQGRTIPNATSKNSGVMTKMQAAQLAALVAGGGGGGGNITITINPNVVPDLGAAINAADAVIGAQPGTIAILDGDGTFLTQAILSNKRTLLLGIGTYTPVGLAEALILFKDNTFIIGSGWGTVFLEPDTWVVLAAYNNAVNNFADGQTNVTMRDFQVKGNAAGFNSTPAAIAIGNSHNVIVEKIFFNSTKSIGLAIGAGGDNGFHASEVRVSGCLQFNVASQGVGAVNAKNFHIDENTFLAGGQFGGPGATYIDLEPNGAQDIIENFSISGNIIDARGSSNEGNGILVQSGGQPVNDGVVVGNTIIGGSFPLVTPEMANAIYLNSVSRINVIGNELIRASQAGIKLFSAHECLVDGNLISYCGGGGNPAVDVTTGSTNNTISNNETSAPLNTHGPCDVNIVESDTANANVIINNVLGFLFGDMLAGRPTVTLVGADSVAYNNIFGNLKVDQDGDYQPVTLIAANASVALNDVTILVDTTTGDITLTLPDLTAGTTTSTNRFGRFLRVQRYSGGNNIILQTVLLQTFFGGGTSETIADGNPFDIVTDGTNWYVLHSSGGNVTDFVSYAGPQATVPPTIIWAAPALLNGWGNFGGGYQDAGYYKDALGFVHIRGLVIGGVSGKPGAIFVLPPGFRPLAQIFIGISSNSALGALEIDPDGTVWLADGSSTTQLDNISFYAEQ